MRILALDLGKRRTGVAFAESDGDFVIALETISHDSTDALIERISAIVSEKKVDALAIGLPFLPDGTEGEQARYVRMIAETIQKHLPLPQTFIDERYTTTSKSPCRDPDAVAACKIAEIALSKPNTSH